MDFAKFVSLLDSAALFFSRADCLSDPWEGATSIANLGARVAQFRDATNAQDAELVAQEHTTFMRALRLHTFLNCWHLNAVESAAMWQLYAREDAGIAIRSTVKRLASCFGNETDWFEVYIGKVKYIDYGQTSIPEGNTFFPFLHKRSSFRHEQELRAVIQVVLPGGAPLADAEPYADGLLVEAHLPTLIEAIHISPTADRWMSDLVEDVLRKYGLEVPVRRSSLASDPLF